MLYFDSPTTGSLRRTYGLSLRKRKSTRQASTLSRSIFIKPIQRKKKPGWDYIGKAVKLLSSITKAEAPSNAPLPFFMQKIEIL